MSKLSIVIRPSYFDCIRSVKHRIYVLRKAGVDYQLIDRFTFKTNGWTTMFMPGSTMEYRHVAGLRWDSISGIENIKSVEVMAYVNYVDRSFKAERK